MFRRSFLQGFSQLYDRAGLLAIIGGRGAAGPTSCMHVWGTCLIALGPLNHYIPTTVIIGGIGRFLQVAARLACLCDIAVVGCMGHNAAFSETNVPRQYLTKHYAG